MKGSEHVSVFSTYNEYMKQHKNLAEIRVGESVSLYRGVGNNYCGDRSCNHSQSQKEKENRNEQFTESK